MAKATLPTNYQDDILNVSTEGKRKYRMVYNDDGTVSFDDVTPYDQEGSDFGAGDINATNEAVNQSLDKAKVIDDLETIQAVTNEGFVMGALAGKALNESLNNLDLLTTVLATSSVVSNKTVNVENISNYRRLLFIIGGATDGVVASIYEAQEIPTFIFKEMTTVTLIFVNGSNQRKLFTCKYISDTQISVSIEDTPRYLRIYGIK